MAGKSKVIKSDKSNKFAKGGSGHMFGKQDAGTQKPEVSAHSTSGSGGFGAKGGSGKMFGYRGAETAHPGKSSPC